MIGHLRLTKGQYKALKIGEKIIFKQECWWFQHQIHPGDIFEVIGFVIPDAGLEKNNNFSPVFRFNNYLFYNLTFESYGNFIEKVYQKKVKSSKPEKYHRLVIED